MEYRNAEREQSALLKYSWEVWRDKHMCQSIPMPSKKILRRYGLDHDSVTFAWYLLEQYKLGNIIIKENVTTQQSNKAADKPSGE